MAEPAKIELLTRRNQGSGFITQTVESSQAYLEFRPKRLPSSEWELREQPRGADGSANYVLRSSRRDRYLLLTQQEYFLWQCFDGKQSLNETARTFHLQFGAFDYVVIRQLIAKLYAAGLIEDAADYRLRPTIARVEGRWWVKFARQISRRWKSLSFRVRNADRYCSALYRYGGFLFFNWIALVILLVIAAAAIAAVVALAPEAKAISLRLAGHGWLTAGTMVASMLIVSMLHVLVHALACKSYGRRVREMGFFLLQGVLPTFYADVTDIFMASRKARVMVDLAGPLVEVIAGSAAFLAAYVSSPGVAQSLYFATGILLWEGALLNLYPFNFLEMDGYNIVADLFGMPGLRQQALSLPSRLRTHHARWGKGEWIQLAYLVLCAISVLVYVILHLDAVGIKIWDK